MAEFSCSLCASIRKSEVNFETEMADQLAQLEFIFISLNIPVPHFHSGHPKMLKK